MLEKIKSLKPKTTTDWLMLAVMAGLVIVAPAAAAQVVLAFIKDNSKSKKEQKISSRQISRAIYDLKRRKVIEFREKGGHTTLVLTEKGERRKLKFNFENMQIPKVVKWDHKWRMLMFDIPESNRASRNIFREKLKQLGFSQFQQSVWIHPYPCENEIDFISEHFHIAEHVNLITVAIEDDSPLRAKFDL